MPDNMPAKYTPGPWEVWEGHTRVFAGPTRENTRSSISGARREICQMEWSSIAESEETDNDEMAANAQLIAAAPELLDALTDAWNRIEAYGFTASFPVVKIRMALAKAAGDTL